MFPKKNPEDSEHNHNKAKPSHIATAKTKTGEY